MEIDVVTLQKLIPEWMHYLNLNISVCLVIVQAEYMVFMLNYEATKKLEVGQVYEKKRKTTLIMMNTVKKLKHLEPNLMHYNLFYYY